MGSSTATRYPKTLVIIAVLAVSGCYRSEGQISCEIACATATDCPSGQACGDQSFCAAAGVRCNPGGGVSDAPPSPDVPTDGIEPDGPPAEFCIGTDPVRICFEDGPPTGAIVLGFNQNTGDTCPRVVTLGSGIGEVCVFAANTVTSSIDAHILGLRPAVIVGVTSITVNTGATIDAGSSLLPLRFGAGAQPAICPIAGMTSNNSESGAGGSFGTRGGSGATPAGPGKASEATLPVAFHGGCAGGSGSAGVVTPGAGGGALYLISDDLITIDGAVMAGGAGGGGGDLTQSASGAGSGGYIGLDAPTIMLGNAGQVIATGGGGGEGGDSVSSGLNGSSPTPQNPIGVAGQGGGTGGNGGNGGGGGTGVDGLPGTGANSASGGGGGGAGYIQIFRFTGGCGAKCTPTVTP